MVMNRFGGGSAWAVVGLCAGLLLATAVACSDDTTGTPADQGVGSDFEMNKDTGPKKKDGGVNPKQDTGAKPKQDKGVKPNKDTGTKPKQDKGVKPNKDINVKPPPDKGIKPKQDKGQPPKPDKGIKPPPDKGAPPPIKCIPGFGLKNACGGNAVGKWTYKAGCVNLAIFNNFKKLCPTFKASNTAYALTSGKLTLQGGKMTRNVSGVVTSTVLVPFSCLGITKSCVVAQGIIASLVKGAKATCSKVGNACKCKVTLPVKTSDSGTWSSKGGIATIKGTMGVTKSYYYCVKNNTLTYRGTNLTTDDNMITYVLQ